MRAFLALEISPKARAGLSEAIRLLRPESFRVKWVDPDLMHLTLKFFADLPEDRLDPLSTALRGVTEKTAPFMFKLKELGFFGARERMRVLWCGVAEGAEAISALQRETDGALVPLGLPREERPFSPHLTIGRLREPAREPHLARALERMKDYEAGEVRADRLILFSSVLTPRGPIYKLERTWPFEAPS
jgi:2'-5' RNA ligase